MAANKEAKSSTLPTRKRYDDTGSAVITQTRHRAQLKRCLEHLDEYAEHDGNGDVVLAAEALRQAVAAVGEITGRADVEEVLGVIFKDFCIGK